jgi:hypothetical protein
MNSVRHSVLGLTETTMNEIRTGEIRLCTQAFIACRHSKKIKIDLARVVKYLDHGNVLSSSNPVQEEEIKGGIEKWRQVLGTEAIVNPNMEDWRAMNRFIRENRRNIVRMVFGSLMYYVLSALMSSRGACIVAV